MLLIIKSVLLLLLDFNVCGVIGFEIVLFKLDSFVFEFILVEDIFLVLDSFMLSWGLVIVECVIVMCRYELEDDDISGG